MAARHARHPIHRGAVRRGVFARKGVCAVTYFPPEILSFTYEDLLAFTLIPDASCKKYCEQYEF